MLRYTTQFDLAWLKSLILSASPCLILGFWPPLLNHFTTTLLKLLSELYASLAMQSYILLFPVVNITFIYVHTSKIWQLNVTPDDTQIHSPMQRVPLITRGYYFINRDNLRSSHQARVASANNLKNHNGKTLVIIN